MFTQAPQWIDASDLSPAGAFFFLLVCVFFDIFSVRGIFRSCYDSEKSSKRPLRRGLWNQGIVDFELPDSIKRCQEFECYLVCAFVTLIIFVQFCT